MITARSICIGKQQVKRQGNTARSPVQLTETEKTREVENGKGRALPQRKARERKRGAKSRT
jgi:hypothetical protein